MDGAGPAQQRVRSGEIGARQIPFALVAYENIGTDFREGKEFCLERKVRLRRRDKAKVRDHAETLPDDLLKFTKSSAVKVLPEKTINFRIISKSGCCKPVSMRERDAFEMPV